VDVEMDEGRFGHGRTRITPSPEDARTRRGATLLA
jgi:hypothetical protein